MLLCYYGGYDEVSSNNGYFDLRIKKYHRSFIKKHMLQRYEKVYFTIYSIYQSDIGGGSSALLPVQNHEKIIRLNVL